MSDDGRVYLTVKQDNIPKKVLEERLRQHPRTRQVYKDWREEEMLRAQKQRNREAKRKPIVIREDGAVNKRVR